MSSGVPEGVVHSRAVDPSRSFTPEEAAVEQRASDRVRQNPAGLAEEYVRKFGNEIGTDNAREIIRYSIDELRPKLRAALEKEYSNGRISEPVYRATLGPSSPEAPGGVSSDRRSATTQTGRQGTSSASLLGDSGRVAAGKPESERPEGHGSSQPGSSSLGSPPSPSPSKEPNPIPPILGDASGTS